MLQNQPTGQIIIKVFAQLFALMKACCQMAETLVSFLLLQQLSEDFY